MACLAKLKQDIKFLENTFPKDHERFQIRSASVDELSCRFVGRNGEKFSIQANITETYPQTAPIWFSDCEDAALTSVISRLTDIPPEQYNIVQQVQILVKDLCKLHDVPVPLIDASGDAASVPMEINSKAAASNPNDTSDEEEEDEFHYDMEDEVPR